MRVFAPTIPVSIFDLIPEIPNSNLGWDTNYPEFFVVYLRLSKRMPGSYLKLGHGHFPVHPYPLFTITQTFNVTQYGLLKASLNK
jgi:hypothetical protein